MSLFSYKIEGKSGVEVNTPIVKSYSSFGIVVLILGLNLLLGGWTIINPGERGVVTRLGKVDRVMESGFNFKMPFIEKVKKFEVKTQKIEVEASAASKDLQIVTTNIALNFNVLPEAVGTLYELVGVEYKARIIDPAIQDVVKAATAQYNAEALITKRAEVKDIIEASLKERLARNSIVVTELSIVNFDFSESFNAAIEQKVTAEQNALREENKLKQVQFEAQQIVEKAKADAEAIRIQAQAINSQGGEDYVNLKAVEKWNGILPTQMIPGGSIPFINLTK